MKRLLWAIGVLVCVCGAGQAETRPGMWLRRLTMAGACAASFWDLQTTRTAVGYGGVESNRWLADAQGKPRWGRMVGMKIGVCAGTALAQELGARYMKKSSTSYAWAGMNAALTARFVSVALSNRRMTGVLRQEQSVPGYLLKPANGRE